MTIHKIALFKAVGKSGRRITEEALKRGYNVTLIVRDEKEIEFKHPNLKVIKGDVVKKEDISRKISGHDLVICAHEPILEKPDRHIDITAALIEGAKSAGVKNIISIGHAFSHPMENTQEFYDQWKSIARAQQGAFKLFQKEEGLNWAYIRSIEPEMEEAGKYNTSTEVFFTSSQGNNTIPIKNYSAALFNEIEKRQNALHEYEYIMNN